MPEDVVYPDLAKRLQIAIDTNRDVPLHNHGRLGWFQDRLSEKGIEVGIETIRKWFIGATHPRPAAMLALAEILKDDPGYLSTGKRPDFNDAQQRRHYTISGAMVNVVAGFIQADGGYPAFPAEDDVEAVKQGIHLFAIIRGAKYNLHIVPATEEKGQFVFLVPHDAKDTLILGVLPAGRFAVRIFELDWESVERVGVRKSGGFQVGLQDARWKEIESFSKRI